MSITPGETAGVRVPRRGMLLRGAVPSLPAVPFAVFIWWPPDRFEEPPSARVVWCVMALGAVVLLTDSLLRPVGVDLEDDVAVVIRPVGGRRRVPWRDVQAVTRGRYTTLHLASGRRVVLAYPAHGWMVPWKRFDDDFHRVGRWWLAHRGPDRQPVHVPPPYPASTPVPDAAPRPVEEIRRTPPETRR